MIIITEKRKSKSYPLIERKVVRIMTKINFEVCPNCKADFKLDGIAYVEDGCTNYLNYKKGGKRMDNRL